MWFHRKKERRKKGKDNAMKRKEFDEKKAALSTLSSVNERAKVVDGKVESLRRLARLGNLDRR